MQLVRSIARGAGTRLARRTLSALAGLVAVSTASAQSAEVTLSLVPGAESVIAHYVLSEPVTTLRFPGGGTVRRKTWKPRGLARLGANGESIEFGTPTKSFSVELREFARDGEIDRVYSPVILLGDGRGAEVYSEYLLPKAGGLVRFDDEGTAFGRRMPKRTVAWRANDSATYLLVGPQALQDRPHFSVTFDAATPVWAARRIEQVATAAETFYARRLGALPTPRPWLLVSHTGTDRPGATFRGDTNPGMVRLNLVGRDWAAPSPERRVDLDRLVAHELFHLWNGQRRELVDDAEPWLLEGGADAAARVALRESRLEDAAEGEAWVEDAFIKCAATPGDTLGQKLANGGRSYYDCGAAVFFLASSLPTKSGDVVDALTIWSALLAPGHAESRPSLAKSAATTRFIEAVRGTMPADSASTAAGTLLQDLVQSDRPWNQVLEKGRETWRLRRAGIEDIDNAIFARNLLDAIVIHAVEKDCHGSASVGYENQVYQVGSLPECERIRASMTLTALEGHAMNTQPGLAARRALAQCAAGQELHFQGRDDEKIALRCADDPLSAITTWVPESSSARRADGSS